MGNYLSVNTTVNKHATTNNSHRSAPVLRRFEAAAAVMCNALQCVSRDVSHRAYSNNNKQYRRSVSNNACNLVNNNRPRRRRRSANVNAAVNQHVAPVSSSHHLCHRRFKWSFKACHHVNSHVCSLAFNRPRNSALDQIAQCQQQCHKSCTTQQQAAVNAQPCSSSCQQSASSNCPCTLQQQQQQQETKDIADEIDAVDNDQQQQQNYYYFKQQQPSMMIPCTTSSITSNCLCQYGYVQCATTKCCMRRRHRK